jgi:probable HAF family extracellular repeat protein
MRIRALVVVNLLVGMASGALAPAGPPRLISLGNLPGEEMHSTACAISPDGQIVAGYSGNNLIVEAFRWTQADGIVSLGDLPGWDVLSIAADASNNGVIVGRGHSSNVGPSPSSYDFEAFRWSPAGGMVGMGDLPGSPFVSEAWGVSADGTVIVGWGVYGPGIGAPWREGWRWTAQTGLQRIGRLYENGNSWAIGVSADGSVIVGRATTGGPGYDTVAFRWHNGVMSSLGFLYPEHDYSSAFAVSGDGATIVGLSRGNQTGNHAFRWTAESGMIYLGDLPNGHRADIPYAVSGDGSIIGGRSSGGDAMLWTAENGSRVLKQILIEDYGLDLSAWNRLYEVQAISDDGRSVVGKGQFWNIPSGTGSHNEAFLAYLPPLPCDLPGNVDGNCVVDARDGAAFPACMTGPAAPGLEASCHYADVDQDTDADLADFAALQRLVAGP